MILGFKEFYNELNKTKEAKKNAINKKSKKKQDKGETIVGAQKVTISLLCVIVLLIITDIIFFVVFDNMLQFCMQTVTIAIFLAGLFCYNRKKDCFKHFINNLSIDEVKELLTVVKIEKINVDRVCEAVEKEEKERLKISFAIWTGFNALVIPPFSVIIISFINGISALDDALFLIGAFSMLIISVVFYPIAVIDPLQNELMAKKMYRDVLSQYKKE